MVFYFPQSLFLRMAHLNVEIKAICANPDFVRKWLLDHHANFRGTDYQTDTYFNVKSGRLKLREGNIENNLIYYERKNDTGPKDSNFELISIADSKSLKQILSKTIGVRVVVEKKREIYFIDNVKFHIDEVPGLGSFIEIEAGNLHTDLSQKQLKQQCEFYLQEFGVNEHDLVPVSYSDMLLDKIGS
jgi:adenylate cyclase, class 2